MREPRCRIGYGHPANSHQKSARKWPGCGAGLDFLYYYSLHDNVAEGFVSCHVMFRHVKSSHIIS